MEPRPKGPEEIVFREDFAHGPQRWLVALVGDEESPRFALENPKGPEVALCWRGSSDPKGVAGIVRMLADSLKEAGFDVATLEVYGRDVRKDFVVPPRDRAAPPFRDAMPEEFQVCSAAFAGEPGRIRFWVATGREERSMRNGGETAGIFMPIGALGDGPRARQVWSSAAAAVLATWPGAFEGRIGPWLRAIRVRVEAHRET